jgi:acetyl esterase/lipase
MTAQCFVLSLWTIITPAQAPATQTDRAPDFTLTENVIYGRKFGMALTMDVFTPKEHANGAAVIWAVSGGWVSGRPADGGAGRFPELLRRGYTCFSVVHGSQPKYTIPEVLEDMHLAIRFIRHNATRFRIDPDRIGIMGGSAGGHLSLMMGLDQQPGKPNKKDAVMREVSRVQAVACFYPPTDFLNWGAPGRDVYEAMKEELKPFQAPFDFHEFDEERKMFVPITDRERRMKILRETSPITHVSSDDPPILIIHGDADLLVPIEQSRRLMDKLNAAGVTTRLIVRPGAKHGWPGLTDDLSIFADWFDRHLAKKPTTNPSPN